MKRQDNNPLKGIEIIKDSQDRNVVVSSEGLEVQRKRKPVSVQWGVIGYFYFLALI